MSAEIKDVQKVLVGDDLLYQDTDGWVPLKLPDSVTSGCVFFKDNHDGTGSLSGAILISMPEFNDNPSRQNMNIIQLPAGYQFTTLDWDTVGGKAGMYATSGFGEKSAGINITIACAVSDGILIGYNNSNYGTNITIRFTKSAVRTDSGSAGPAIVGIKKV